MSKKDNFNQAMYEMFGVGKTPEAKAYDNAKDSAKEAEYSEYDNAAAEAAAAEAAAAEAAAAEVEAVEIDTELAELKQQAAAQVTAKRDYPATYIAEGTVIEGTVRSVGDIEVAGDVKGDVISEGSVTIRSAIEGNINAVNLSVISCAITGDIDISGQLYVDETSKITGNIKAENFVCSGTVKGNLDISKTTALEKSASVEGDIRTGDISVVRGAVIKGSVNIG